MARELNIDSNRLEEVLLGFPGLFRKSRKTAPANGQHFYSLQARYAQYNAKEGEEPESISDIDPIDTEKLKLLLDFVLKMAVHEKTDTRVWWAHLFSIIAVVVAAFAAIFAATLKGGG